jgi:hypothetical protein
VKPLIGAAQVSTTPATAKALTGCRGAGGRTPASDDQRIPRSRGAERTNPIVPTL